MTTGSDFNVMYGQVFVLRVVVGYLCSKIDSPNKRSINVNFHEFSYFGREWSEIAEKIYQRASRTQMDSYTGARPFLVIFIVKYISFPALFFLLSSSLSIG